MQKLTVLFALFLFACVTSQGQHRCVVIKVTAFSRNMQAVDTMRNLSSVTDSLMTGNKERVIYIVSCCDKEPVIRLNYGKIRARSTVIGEEGRTIIAGRDSSGRKIVIGAPLGYSIWRVNVTGPDQLMNIERPVSIIMKGAVAKNGFSYKNIPEKQLYGLPVF